jgi:Flp pilus assembly protein TadG
MSMKLPQTLFQLGFRGRRAGQRNARGVAAAELAVCLPIVVLLVVATIEACSAIFLKQSLTVAAYEGVRMALVEGATVSNVQTACNQVLADRKIEGATVSVSPVGIEALQPGDYVDVTVTAPCSENSVVPANFYRGRTLSATASMMIEN